jgi:lysozyme family protein
MASSSQTQLSAAIALVQLLQEHPELSDHITWSIPRTLPTLTGYIHDNGMRVLADCARILGGSVRAGKSYKRDDQWVRQHVLSATWRDASVEVVVSAPVAASVVAA